MQAALLGLFPALLPCLENCRKTRGLLDGLQPVVALSPGWLLVNVQTCDCDSLQANQGLALLHLLKQGSGVNWPCQLL